MSERETLLSIGVVLFPDAEELDWAGPWEVLSYWALNFPDDNVRTFTLSRTEGPITCARGLRVIPEHTWASSPAIDVLVYPGGRGTRRQIGDADIAEWLQNLAARGALITSVCTGSLVLASTGLLDGRPATTHRDALRELAALGTSIDVRGHDRFVDDGNVITSAGVSAGIDMALHLVARLHSVARARQVRRAIQYDPEPPV